jgi:hypothetical protein
MKRTLLLSTALGLALLTAPLHATGTATLTTSDQGGGVTKYAIAWVSTAGGAVSANTFSVKGRVLQVKVLPDSGGTQPTDLYDLTIVDADSVDVINGAGANLSNATGKYIQLDPPLILDGTTLDVVIANAGNAKGGTVEIFVGRS